MVRLGKMCKYVEKNNLSSLVNITSLEFTIDTLILYIRSISLFNYWDILPKRIIKQKQISVL